MYTTKVNKQFDFNIDIKSPDNELDMISIREGVFHIIKDNISYTAELVSADWDTKIVIIKVNNTPYSVKIKDKMDLLLEKMGIKNLSTKIINDIKAPMPGLVLDIKVTVGMEVKKGDAVLVLEAMKMENILKSPGDGVVKSIEVTKGNAVEKGQLLVKLN